MEIGKMPKCEQTRLWQMQMLKKIKKTKDLMHNFNRGRKRSLYLQESKMQLKYESI